MKLHLWLVPGEKKIGHKPPAVNSQRLALNRRQLAVNRRPRG